MPSNVSTSIFSLLTILYFNCKTNNKYSNYQKLITDCTNIYNNNITNFINFNCICTKSGKNTRIANEL